MAVNLPAMYWGMGATPIAGFSQAIIKDAPLAGNDTLELTLASSALPATLPEYIRVDGFGAFYLTRRTTSADAPGAVKLDAVKRDNRGAELAAAILAFLQDNGIDAATLVRTPVLRRWELLASRPAIGNRNDQHGIQSLVAQQILDKGATPSLDTLRRGLQARGFTLIEGAFNDSLITGTGISIVPLEFNRNGVDGDGNPVVKSIANYPIRNHVQPLVSALDRRLEFGLLGETIGGGADADSDSAFAVHLGNYDRFNYGVIALEQRRYSELLTSETATARIAYDTGVKVGDIVRDGDMRDWRVTGATHRLDARDTYQTELRLARHYTPTTAQIRRGSPPPYATTAPHLGFLPAAPSISLVSELLRRDGNILQLAPIGGVAVLRISPPQGNQVGKPYLKLQVDDQVGNATRRYVFDMNGAKPHMDLRFVALGDAGEHSFTARYINNEGAGGGATLPVTVTGGRPASLRPVLLTAEDAAAMQAPGGLFGAAIERALSQRTRTLLDSLSDADIDIDNLPQFVIDAPAPTPETQTLIIGRDGVGAPTDILFANRDRVNSSEWFLSGNINYWDTQSPTAGAGDAYILFYAPIIPMGNQRTSIKAQYQIGRTKSGLSDADVVVLSDIDWSGWRDWRAGATPTLRGTNITPNPAPQQDAPDAHSSQTWRLTLNVGANGVIGGARGQISPFVRFSFQAIVVDESGNEVGVGGQTYSTKAIYAPQWTGAHYQPDGALRPEFAEGGSNELRFIG